MPLVEVMLECFCFFYFFTFYLRSMNTKKKRRTRNVVMHFHCNLSYAIIRTDQKFLPSSYWENHQQTAKPKGYLPFDIFASS